MHSVLFWRPRKACGRSRTSLLTMEPRLPWAKNAFGLGWVPANYTKQEVREDPILGSSIVGQFLLGRHMNKILTVSWLSVHQGRTKCSWTRGRERGIFWFYTEGMPHDHGTQNPYSGERVAQWLERIIILPSTHLKSFTNQMLPYTVYIENF